MVKSKNEKATTEADDIVTVVVSAEEHEALLTCEIMDEWLMDLVKGATLTTDGLEISAKRHLIDELAGWVASEANHEREKKRGARRRAKLLNSACDAIEDALR